MTCSSFLLFLRKNDLRAHLILPSISKQHSNFNQYLWGGDPSHFNYIFGLCIIQFILYSIIRIQCILSDLYYKAYDNIYILPAHLTQLNQRAKIQKAAPPPSTNVGDAICVVRGPPFLSLHGDGGGAIPEAMRETRPAPSSLGRCGRWHAFCVRGLGGLPFLSQQDEVDCYDIFPM